MPELVTLTPTPVFVCVLFVYLRRGGESHASRARARAGTMRSSAVRELRRGCCGTHLLVMEPAVSIEAQIPPCVLVATEQQQHAATLE